MVRNIINHLNLKNMLLGIKLLWIYIVANIILIFNYDKKRFITGKWFEGSKYGRFTAIGWTWVVNDYFSCRKLGVNKHVPWPVSPRIIIGNPDNIVFHPDDLNNFQGVGNYYQAIGKTIIGRGSYIAPNVGIITSNHDIFNLDEHEEAKPVIIGERCWIGMNCMILPGVILGAHTIVGAGSVVTKSFPDGECIIAGNPAKVIKLLNDKGKFQK